MQRPALERACSSFAPFSDYDALYTAPDEELGRGASGVVRKAYRRSDGLGVAVKTMDLRALRMHGGDAFKIKKLRREVDVLRTLAHENIVHLYGAFGDDDTVRLVMELVEGRELFDAILSRGHYSEADARPIFVQLLKAVDYMHQRNVIHRDLKPENVLVTGDGEDVVKLVDFGLSKHVASAHGGSRAHTMVGTPSYLAPEVELQKPRARSLDMDQLDGDDSEDFSGVDLSDGSMAYDAKVDSWSLGVTLYVMLVARFPVYHRDERGRIFGVKVPHALSAPARKLVEDLLNADPEVRATAADALASPWVWRSRTTTGTWASWASRARARAVARRVVRSALPPRLRDAGLDYHERALASRALATKLRGTALLVLEMIDDLKVARAAAVARAAEPARGARARRAGGRRAAARRRRRRAARRVVAQPGESLDLNVRSDDDILELMLPVTADDLRAPDDGADGLGDHDEHSGAASTLLKCLGELHVVFSRMELFWSKVEVSLDTVLKRSEALEVLLNFADTPLLKSRLDLRLDKFKAFWVGLAEWELEPMGAAPTPTARGA
ncbi:protein serine/threonine kinase [Aureococcus anophagefferens]|uniref:Protein serine/threonine kinase n=1 Tax=Aureococcus anophagefferens TaxID=44056 RepID=A0ABR1GBK7_AURAN